MESYWTTQYKKLLDIYKSLQQYQTYYKEYFKGMVTLAEMEVTGEHKTMDSHIP